MTIAQALKEKNKKVSKIQKLWSRISQHNSSIEGAEKPYDLEATWEDYNAEVTSLIELKTKIHNASAPVRDQIFTLSELKTKINNVRSLNTTNGRFRDRYADDSLEMEAHFDIKWKDSQMDLIEGQLDAIQEKLDHFNNTTQI